MKEFLHLILAQALTAFQLACLALDVEKKPFEDQLGLKTLPVHSHGTLVQTELLILVQCMVQIIFVITCR